MKKKIVAIAILSVFLYGAVGFFAVPIVAEKQTKKVLHEMLGAEVFIESIFFNPFTFETEITNFVIPGHIQLGKLKVDLEIFPLFTKKLLLKSLFIGNASGDLKILKNGMTNWTSGGAPQTASSAQKSAPWALTLESIQIENTRVTFTDETHREPLQVEVGPIALAATNISTVLDSQTSLNNFSVAFGEKGFLNLGGTASLKPLGADIDVELAQVPLEFLTSYLSDKTNLQIRDGTLNLKGKVNYTDGKLVILADAAVQHFNVVETLTGKSAFSWEALSLNQLEFKTTPLSLLVKEVAVMKPDTSVVLKKDGTLNFKEYFRKQPVSDGNAKAGKNFDMQIGSIRILDGKLKFSDQQIRPAFSANITRLDGAAGPLTLSLEQKINLKLTGKVEAQGKFKAAGWFGQSGTLPALDLNAGFSNIELTTFTPYSGRFLGYEIKKGKLFLDLNYTLVRNKIRGKNSAVLDQLTLGNKVENDTSTGLPVKLALALLKDRQGKIKINLPVEGDVNSPKFAFGELIYTALKNMILNIVAAPFDFLKDLITGSDKPDSIFFQPGEALLASAQRAKLDEIAKVLAERPELVLEIQGHYQDSDIEPLKKVIRKSEIGENELKKLAMQRGQAIQNAMAGGSTEAERIYLLATEREQQGEQPPRGVLFLKHRE